MGLQYTGLPHLNQVFFFFWSFSCFFFCFFCLSTFSFFYIFRFFVHLSTHIMIHLHLEALSWLLLSISSWSWSCKLACDIFTVMDREADKVACLLMSRQGDREPGWYTDSQAVKTGLLSSDFTHLGIVSQMRHAHMHTCTHKHAHAISI